MRPTVAALVLLAGCAGPPSPRPGEGRGEGNPTTVQTTVRTATADTKGTTATTLTLPAPGTRERETKASPPPPRSERQRRLQAALAAIGIDAQARKAALGGGGEAAKAANDALAAYDEGRDVEAMLFSAVAVGEDPQNEFFRRLNTALAARTGLDIPLEELLPRVALVQLKLQRAEKAFLEDRFGEAARDCQEAVWLDPRNVLAWTRLGSARWASGEKDKAIKAFHSALALDPGNAEVRGFLTANGLPIPPPPAASK